MKDYMNLWGFLAGRTYDAVNTNSGECVDVDTAAPPARRRSRRCSSVVVNRFFTDKALIERRKRSRCGVVLMLLGVLAVAMGTFIVVVDPYHVIFKWKLTFSEGSDTFEMWRTPPVDLYLKAYLFNVTNKDAFLSGKEKLRVQEVGPYVYRELMNHDNVTFNDNGTITMVPKHPLVWVPELSNGTEDDLLMLPNIALLSIANVVRDASYFTRMGLNLLIRQTDTNPFVLITAKEFMFGYKSALTTLGNKMLPSWIYFDKIGLVERMYDFNGDVATVHTGEKDLHLTGIFDTYRGSKQLPQWEGSCGTISGASDATKFNSLIRPNDTMFMYRKSMGRAMPMVRTGETVLGGLKGYNYTWKDGALDNGARDPNNKCFCRKGHCLQEGLIDVTDSYYGFPIALSYPHFYKADPALIEAVDGSFPEKEKHQTEFVIQPDSGLPLHLAVRFQINMAFGDITPISRVGRFSNMVLPMMWSEIGMDRLPSDMEFKFFIYLNVAPVVLDVAVYVFFIGGSVLLIASIARVFKKTWAQRSNCEEDTVITGKSVDCIQANRRASIKAKEMDVYFSSLLMPYEDHLSIVKESPSHENVV